MWTHKLKNVETLHQAPSGRAYREIKPVLFPDCCALGTLSFATWQVWEDEPQTHEAARGAALDSARRVLLEFTKL